MERDGNGWVECDLGHRHWGLHGAAGLLLHSVDADGALRVLLQHRADWCHHGGTWGLPGGARDSHETVEEAALREAAEETALDVTQVRLRHTFVDDHGGWSYTTVYADALTQLDTVPNEESAALEWVGADRVDALPLHPGFGHTWPDVQLAPLDARRRLGQRPRRDSERLVEGPRRRSRAVGARSLASARRTRARRRPRRCRHLGARRRRGPGAGRASSRRRARAVHARLR